VNKPGTNREREQKVKTAGNGPLERASRGARYPTTLEPLPVPDGPYRGLSGDFAFLPSFAPCYLGAFQPKPLQSLQKMPICLESKELSLRNASKEAPRATPVCYPNEATFFFWNACNESETRALNAYAESDSDGEAGSRKSSLEGL
jgi:hypothetical protein